jgi:hypothetical protein
MNHGVFFVHVSQFHYSRGSPGTLLRPNAGIATQTLLVAAFCKYMHGAVCKESIIRDHGSHVFFQICSSWIVLFADMLRAKRTPGESRAQDPKFQTFLQQIRENSAHIGECEGRVLRLKPTVSSNARPEEINHVLGALMHNWRVEVLYIQNFELVRSLFYEILQQELDQDSRI